MYVRGYEDTYSRAPYSNKKGKADARSAALVTNFIEVSMKSELNGNFGGSIHIRSEMVAQYLSYHGLIGVGLFLSFDSTFA